MPLKVGRIGLTNVGRFTNNDIPPTPLTTTFNPADQSTQITLSNGNLTATNTTSSGDRQVRSTTSKSAGKFYVEITIVFHDGVSGQNLGLGLASASHAFTNFLGQELTSVALWPSSTTASDQIYLNNATTAYGASVGALTGDVYGIAIDFTGAKIWWNNLTEATGWNNDVIGNQNPATGTGGFSFASMTGSPFFICVDMEGLNNALTANFGNSAFTGTVPSGFTAWDAQPAVTLNNYLLPGVVGSYAITGNSAALLEGHLLAGAIGSYSITGSAAQFGLTEPWATGAYNITGQAGALLANREIDSAAGSYAITGAASTGALAGLDAAGSYGITGSAANFVLTEPWAVGSYTISGTAATLIRGRLLLGAVGTYTVTGSAANFVLPEAWGVGSYSITGSPAALALTEAPTAGSYSISGSNAALIWNHQTLGVVGSYTVTGSPATLIHGEVLPDAPGAYSITGFAAALAKGGTPVSLRDIDAVLTKKQLHELRRRLAAERKRRMRDFDREIETRQSLRKTLEGFFAKAAPEDVQEITESLPVVAKADAAAPAKPIHIDWPKLYDNRALMERTINDLTVVLTSYEARRAFEADEDDVMMLLMS